MNKILARLACTVIASSISLFASAEEIFLEEEMFDLGDIKTLSLKMDHADISIISGKDHELKVTLKQTLKSGDPETCLHNINHSDRGNRLEVFTKMENSVSFSRCDIQRSVHIELDQQTIQSLMVKHSHGNILVEEFIPKDLSLAIAHSNLNLKKLEVKTADLKIDHTNFEGEKVTAEKLKFSGSHGNVNIGELQSNRMTLSWSHGDVKIDRSVVQHLKAQQGHSDIEMKMHEGIELDLHSAHGRILVGKSKAEVVELKNSHGSTSYAGSSQKLKFSSSHGSTSIVQYNPEFVHIKGKATHGSIDVALPKGSLCNLEGAAIKQVNAEMFRAAGNCDEEKSEGLVKLRTTHGKAKVNVL